MRNNHQEYSIDRPLPVTIALVFVLCMTVWNGIRAWTVIANWDLLSRFNANPTYIFLTGIIWLVIDLVLIVILLRGSRLTLVFGLVASILYIIWNWVDKLVIQASPASNIPFSIVVSITGFLIFNTFLFWPSSRAFFKEMQ